MNGKSGVGLSRRRRRIRRSVVWMGLGGVALIAGAYWLERSRNTDLANPEDSVTSQFVHSAERESAIRYTDVSDQSGLSMRHGPGARQRLLPEDTGSGLAWGDFDGDGDWDLYAVNIPGSDPTEIGTNRLFRNDGGRFVEVGEGAGVADPTGFGMGASFVDYDGDGDQDIYVTNHGP
ncbi:MAG: VCBS repeat-containing protein, partial [Planctomycetota bacterium]|nr:VCBS repeat-containing protein [Planctomycetota bacterium]